MTQSAYQEEVKRLEETNRQIDSQLRRLRSVPVYHGSDLTEQALESAREQARRNLTKAVDEPYFGRLDFAEAGLEQPQPLYIGKAGVEDERTGQPLVIDWRAPVASLFYSFAGGLDAAAYESPDGLIEGLVYLKRNLVIRKQILQRVVDTYDREQDSAAVGDEFLLYRLGENKDNKLRDIVSTIQAEQDRIIRSAKNAALIIQGVAGSGKTTVALHRLAYLLYQYREQIRAERMIIFAPNHMFLDYISGVLPELGVGNIQQSTFADWALEVLDAGIKLADPAAELSRWFAPAGRRPAITAHTPGVYKGGIAFMKLINDAWAAFEQSYVPAADFQPWEGLRLPYATVKEWFYSEYKHYPLAKRRERVVGRIKRWLEIQLEKIWETARKKELKKTSAQRLRAYLKTWPDPTALSFYKLLFAEAAAPSSLPPELTAAIPRELAAETNKLLKKNTVRLEDLAPLVHIHVHFNGISSDLRFDHIVIDEAQDFSPFQVKLLDAFTQGSSFTILGDMSQGIHAYQGISEWKAFLDLFPDSETGYFELERSYRSTLEIIRFANQVLLRGVEAPLLAVPVFRSGNRVRIVPCAADEQRLLIQAVQRVQAGTASTIAVIGRTDSHCEKLYAALSEAGIAAHLITAGQREYRGGISVLPVYAAKGLEFDAVLLAGATREHYGHNMLDAKLLYVGCTRALHELWLLAEGELSPLIDTSDSEFVAVGWPE